METNGSHLCIICGQEKDTGITIVTEFICESCEAEMVKTDVRDDKYPFFINRLRRIWVQQNA